MANKLELTAEKQREVVSYFSRILDTVITSRRELDGSESSDGKVTEWWSRFRGDWSSKKDKDFPWKDSADFHIPFVTWVCTSAESRLNNAVFGADDLAMFTSDNIENEEKVERIQNYMRYEFFKRIMIEEPMAEGIQRQCVEGTMFLMPVYEKDKRVLRKYKRGKIKIGNKEIDTYVPDFVESIVNGLKKILPTDKISIQRNEKIVYEGNKLHVIPLKDVLWWGGNDFQKNDGVAVRQYLNIRQIQDKVKTDGWFNIEKLKKKSTVNTKGAEDRDKREAKGMEEADLTLNAYTPYRIWAYYDIDDDGYAENCEFVVDVENKTLLYAGENDNFWGMRPIIPIPLFRIAGSLLGQGFPERLGIINDELDTLHNQVIDNSTAINAQTITYIEKFLSHDMDRITFRPGAAIPVKNHDAIRPLQLAARAIDLNYQEQFVKDIMERLAIVTDYSLGREANIERPTARGKAMSLQEYAVNFDIILRNLRLGLKDMVIFMLRNLYQYMPAKGIEFPVLDKNGEVTRDQEGKPLRQVLKRDDLEIIDELNIQIAASAINAVKGLEQQNAFALFDRLSPDNTGETNTHGLKEYLIKSVDKRVLTKILRDPIEIQKLQEAFQRIEQLQQELDAKSQEVMMREADMVNKESIIRGGKPVVSPQGDEK